MICPIMASPKGAFRNCQKELCALYTEKETCAIRSIADNLQVNISSGLDEGKKIEGNAPGLPNYTNSTEVAL